MIALLTKARDRGSNRQGKPAVPRGLIKLASVTLAFYGDASPIWYR